MRLCAALFIGFTQASLADSMVATRTIHAQSVLSVEDIAMVAADIPGALTDPDAALGQEARVTLYAGRPIHAADLGTATLVERNQAVTLIFRTGGGGGYGPARKREPERVAEDVRMGYVSVEAARASYGVALDAKTLAVDAKKTATLRARKNPNKVKR